MEDTKHETESTEPRWVAAGPPYLLTRDELVDELQKRRLNVTDRQIRSWVSYGLLPKPILRVPLGAPTGRGQVRALYPITNIGIIQDILNGIRVGWTTERIKERTNERIARWKDKEDEFVPVGPMNYDVRKDLEQAAVQAIRDYAEHIARTRGRSIVKATAEIVLSDGQHQKVFAFPTTEELDEKLLG
jgi:hypothetical protein